MSISQETIQKVKDAVDIVDIVEDFVTLKKKGHYWSGLCPFHDDKSPSFTVTPSRGIYKCFSCGAAGDAIGFVKELEGLTYIETIKYLGKKYGIEIQEKELTSDEKAKQEHKESLFIALNYAKDFFIEKMTKTSEGKSVGIGYFKERGFHNQTIENFELGYSLNQWDAFEKAALQKGFKEDILEAAGLIMRKEDRKYDRFRSRVMFPIHNLAGRVIAFGARTLKKDDKPKYLNSPETEVYHKSDVLYGIFQAKNALRMEDNALLVEGYTDVLSLHQSGIENVVASSGTALTEGQIKLVKRFTNNMTVLYDGDEAGIKASLRGTDLILEQGMDVRVVVLPEGQDPDSYCRELGGQRFKEYIDKHARDFILFKTDVLLKGAENDPIKKANVTRDIVQSIAKIPDPIKQSVFYKECAKLLNIPEELLISEGEKIKQKVIDQKEKAQNRQRREWEQTPPPPPEYYADIPQDIPPIHEEVIPQVEERVVSNDQSFYTKDHIKLLQAREEELIRVLLLYGQTSIGVNGDKLYHFLFDDLDSIVITKPVFHEIIITYKNEAALRRDPDAQFFLDHEDKAVREFAEECLMIDRQFSPNWEEKHRIYTPLKDENLPKLVNNTMLWLNLRSYEKKCFDYIRKIGQVEGKEQQALLTDLMCCTEKKNAFAKELGVVIS
ncbi:DNA primase [Algivirga pacifica]|uniref:DNA primase n=1 Tax=Algivirga pacifica TaxID=1162670 RepID=A0ABP9DK69_9BACT